MLVPVHFAAFIASCIDCICKQHTGVVPYLHSATSVACCSFGSQPDWTIFSESFPVGCAFHHNITYSQFFSVNPDRRRRLYSNPTGMYHPGCGLSAVHMSWTAYEYLHQILVLNKTFLPATAQVSHFLLLNTSCLHWCMCMQLSHFAGKRYANLRRCVVHCALPAQIMSQCCVHCLHIVS